MNALLRLKQEWEYENQKVFIALVKASSDVSIETVKKAGLAVSFFAYLIYLLIGVGLALGTALLRGPQMVRHVGPGERPLEPYEFNGPHLEFQMNLTQPKR